MKTDLIKDFVNYLNKQVENHCAYLWGGQGEYVQKTKIKTIVSMETSDENVARVLEFLAKCYRNKYDMKNARFFDCSGLIVNWLLAREIIKSDMTAQGLYDICEKISIDDIKTGDLVFKKDKNGKIVHVGACVDGKKKLIVESYGRDKGVVRNVLNDGSSSFALAGRIN